MKPPYKVIIETKRLVIFRATVKHGAEMLFKLWNDPRVMQNVGFPQGLRISKQEIVDLLEKHDDDTPFDRRLAVELKETGEIIGECKLGTPDEKGISETDVKLLPAFWGNKYGVEIKRALVDYLFTHTDCKVVQATPNVKNAASIKMQEAVGGIRVNEGVFEFPEKMREHTTPVHHYVYHVLRENWEKQER